MLMTDVVTSKIFLKITIYPCKISVKETVIMQTSLKNFFVVIAKHILV